jgi:hypothetical protein
MYLQGNLQHVFDALYEMGMIEPVLKMDWQHAIKEIEHNPDSFHEVMSVVNTHQEDYQTLMSKLELFSEKTLSYLAMEVAREFADYHSRNEVH